VNPQNDVSFLQEALFENSKAQSEWLSRPWALGGAMVVWVLGSCS